MQSTPSLRTLVAASMMMLSRIPVTSGADASGNGVTNGDFEQIVNDQPVGWRCTGHVKPERVSGVWRRLTCTFNSRDQETVHFFFIAEKGCIGSVWIDRVTFPRALRNAGFEEEGPNGGLAHWSQDDRGVTIFSDPSRASEGHRSVRITHVNEAVPDSRIWQAFPVEPGRDYSLCFDVLIGEDFQGEAKGLVFDAKASACLLSNWGEPFASTLVQDRERCSRYAVCLRPGPAAPAELSQQMTVEPHMNLQASVDIDTRAFRGAAAFVVEDVSSGKVLARSEVRDVSRAWQSLRVGFPSLSTGLRVRVVAEGQGTLLIDNVRAGFPQVSPALQDVRWLPATENVAVSPSLAVSVRGQAGPALEGGLNLLAKDLEAYGVTLARTAPEASMLRILIDKAHAVAGRGADAYRLTVNKAGVTIRAGTTSGAFYGLMTLLQLLTEQDGRPVLLACEATDYPDMPMRGVLYGDPEQAARWKMNTVMVSTGYPVGPDQRGQFRQFVSACQRLNQDVIPYFLSLVGGYYVQQQDPNLAAGISVQGEKLTLRGGEPTALAKPFVIRTQLTDIELTDVGGETRYRLGRDYEVLDGDMAYPYSEENPRRFAVARTPGSSIPDGAPVLATYDHVDHYREAMGRRDVHIPYCPLEPEVRRLMGEFMKNLAKDFPVPYINPSHCLEEFRPAESHLATDSRVIRSGKSPIELLVDDVCFLDRAAKAGRADVRILQWAGHVNGYSREAGPKLPRDALINIWGYDVNWPDAHGREAIAYWSKLGFSTCVMPWNNLRNVRGWAQVVAEAAGKGYPCIGMIDSCWKGVPNADGGVQETAEVSWRIPKAGERRFVPLRALDVPPDHP